MKIDLEMAEIIADFLRVMRRARKKTGWRSSKPWREFVHFYVERQFFSKEAMKRNHAKLHGLKKGDLEYDHPFPISCMVDELFEKADATPQDIQMYFADLPEPRILTSIQHGALGSTMPSEYGDPKHPLYRNKLARYVKAGLA